MDKPIKRLTTAERINLRLEAVIKAQKLINDLLGEHAGAMLDAPVNTLEHEVGRTMYNVLTEAEIAVNREHQQASLAQYYYEKGIEDERSRTNDKA